jgi:microsomal dipeptidase-like Zn-dependent dipeptidase
MNARLPLVLIVAGVAAAAAAPPAEDLAARAARVHREAIVADTHEDVPEALEEKWGAYANWHDIGEPGVTKHVDIPRLRDGGVTAPFFAVYVPAVYAETGGAARYALELSDMVDGMVASHPKDLATAASVADIRRAKTEGRIAVLKGIEGGHAIEDSMGALRGFYRLGVRYMTLTHTNTNHWADSAGNFFAPDYDPATTQVHHGLSGFGRAVVREMNRLGMMVDVSHVSMETVDDVLEASRAPVFASHSSCRALSDIPRNLTDEQIFVFDRVQQTYTDISASLGGSARGPSISGDGNYVVFTDVVNGENHLGEDAGVVVNEEKLKSGPGNKCASAAPMASWPLVVKCTPSSLRSYPSESNLMTPGMFTVRCCSLTISQYG